MLIEWKDLNLDGKVDRLLHVGGHLAEEKPVYSDGGVGEVVWVEADPVRSQQIRELTGDHVICAVVGDVEKEIVFHEANNGQSSSILELGTHKQMHPEVHYVSEVTVTMRRLDDLLAVDNMQPFDMINFDIQGAELLALQGLGEYLNYVKYAYLEVNREPLYQGACLVDELDSYLSGFDRVETVWTPFGWGDAFYVRKGSV